MKKLSVILFSALILANMSIAQETPEQPATPPADQQQPATDAAGSEAAASEEPAKTKSIINGVEDANGVNKYSVRPIHESDIMYQKTLLRAVDLREKQNKPMFSKNKEITKLIIEAVRRGDIKPWASDSLQEGRALTIDEFLENMLMPTSQAELTEEEKQIMLANGDSSFMQGASGPAYYLPSDLYQMQIKENLIFDKQRSRMYYDVHAVTMLVPSDHPANIKGIEIPVASFEYKELVEKLFKDNPEAIWFNPQNDAQHKALGDAFELRLFSSYIIKVSNPTDAYLVDIYGGDQKKGILASQWAAFELLEYEHNLWEF